MSDSYQLLNEINNSNIIWQEYDIYDNNQKISIDVGSGVKVNISRSYIASLDTKSDAE